MQATLEHSVLHYELIHPQKKQQDDLVVLFLHEALGSIGQWKQFPQLLCNTLGLEGIVYERQGHGQSSAFTSERDERYLHQYALEELPAFLTAISEERRVLLVGHSDGGTISLLFASKYPERVAGVVTMAAHVINEPETIAGIQPAIDAYTDGKLEGLKKYHQDKTDALFFAWANIWRDGRFKQWDITAEIENELGYGLFLQGEDDQYGTPKQLELIRNNFGGSTQALLLPNCGHHPHLEQTDRVIEAISNWWR